MKEFYQKILKACAPFERFVGIAFEIAPIWLCLSLIDHYEPNYKISFMFGVFFYMIYRPYSRTLEKWRAEVEDRIKPKESK